MEKRSLDRAFDGIEEAWSPHVGAELNGQALKLARAEDEFVWHRHEDADELFLVRDGRLRIEFREAADVVLEPGELVVVPAGVEHRPVAEPTAELLLFEPTQTRNTGDVETDLTQTERREVDP
ncbi:cupin domain-containing protein [Haloarcula litorea]|uniref:cupin domain-containing protein n=1 Tax=Haloarcula litorea TaxID=3032579 RepID=UPI0023E85F90|nr:cupin domain-containing protein [Halomicroarcula sp. GDY20]